ncbi:hypothetical protein K437DRAFT_260121 [Tilletiaria anomala UBC 951]|uniref:Uncharacterized protein n=1 Tax=Tilletiaria anomala (strain ATCC 24038 / CBS 436.72 / UBC 951) TaxID=1037660 RepID=A0A066V3Y5_TILAU|nr:uncharacterized protein K437DRAFT_260121 [Tilletiaria anomala UBC 951]KDN36417.1 hypothetical protein K437DRAFT_260121 [Tilletiaria anomala UBC 951]
MVGPPDLISNLRPVKYGSAFEEEESAGPSIDRPAAVDARQRLQDSQFRPLATHPYSLSEFSSFASKTTSSLSKPQVFTSGPNGTASRIGTRRPHSQYFHRLLERLETAELEHKLRKIRQDAFHQRFWTDNNLRFQCSLKEYQFQLEAPETVASRSHGAEHLDPTLLTASATVTSPSSAESSSGGDAISQTLSKGSSSLVIASVTQKQQQLKSDGLAPFYTAWLSANSSRHKAYNRALVKGLFQGLGPAMRYESLRWWASAVRRMEKAMGRGS